MAYRHTLLFVYEPRFETGGNFFPIVFTRLLYMTLISQVSQAAASIDPCPCSPHYSLNAAAMSRP